MGLNDHQKKLFPEFPPVPTREWEEKIKTDLKGADYEKKLVWKTDEGFDLRPYYRSENLAGLEYLQSIPGKPFVDGAVEGRRSWSICQDIHAKDIPEANRIALDAVLKGAGSLNLCAVDIAHHKQMVSLLAGIDLEKTAVNFSSSRSYPLTLELFIYEVMGRKNDPAKIRGSLNFDPISYLLIHGDFYISKENNFQEAEYLIRTIEKKLPEFRAITVNGHYFREAGATVVQELAFSLASASEYLSGLTSMGVPSDLVARNLTLSLGTGSGYFMEIVKLRAARFLWSKIIEQYSPQKEDSKKIFIHSKTVLRNKSVFDPYVNMLRTTTEGMSAAIGNADSITIGPFDQVFRVPDDFSERIARNQQLILKEEAHLDKVTDAAAGSYYLENLTHSLVVHAWNQFVEIGEKGGMIECIKSGFIQDEIEKISSKREDDVASRKTVMIGINQYPNTKEPAPEISGTGNGKPQPVITANYKKLQISRDSAQVENLRLSVIDHVRKGGKRPSVFLLSFGNLTMRKARATFATNFFGCAGYDILEEKCFTDADNGVKAALDSKAEFVVLCSSDDEYATMAPSFAEGIKKANKDITVIVAGFPKDFIDTLKASGVDDFIHIRSNLVQTLSKFNKMLGING